MKGLVLWLSLLAAGAACKKKEEETCEKPSGTALNDEGTHLVGWFPVALNAQGTTVDLRLTMQWTERTGPGSYNQTHIKKFSHGETPCQAYDSLVAMWQKFFQDMVDRGLPEAVVTKYAASVSNFKNDPLREKRAGIYAEANLYSCGYNGFEGAIYCLPEASDDIRYYYLAHEGTHGFTWELVNDDVQEFINLYQVFAQYANDFYHQSVSDPSAFTPASGEYSVDPMNYALQNEAEWTADIFKEYLYPPEKAQYGYISKYAPWLKSYFDCIWKDGQKFSDCQKAYNIPMVSMPETTPLQTKPVVDGFSAEDQEAIWNVCFRTETASQYYAQFKSIIDRVAPDLNSEPHLHYKLGFGDCSHDGVIDWVCSYQGPAADGSGYLWNANSQVGAYTFVVSGKKGDSYAEYKQDYFDAKLVTLLQPQYREWQGQYKSCNGASYFTYRKDKFPYYVSGIEGLSEEFKKKTDW
jgi:hypothetical protein